MSALQRDVSHPVFHDTFTILDQHYSPMWDHYFQIQGCIQLARYIIKRVLLLAACGTLVGSAPSTCMHELPPLGANQRACGSRVRRCMKGGDLE